MAKPAPGVHLVPGVPAREPQAWHAGRVLRVGAGLLAVAIGLWMLVFPAFFPITSDAIVNVRVASLQAPIAGWVGRSPLNDGDRVRAGERVVVVTNDHVDRSGLEQMRLRRQALLARLAAVKEELADLERERAHDPGPLRGALSLRVLDARRRSGELEQDLAEVDAERAGEERRLGKLAEAEVTSPIDGTVLRRPVSAGQFVGAGHDLAVVADPGTTVVEAWFHQRFLSEVRPGDHALVHLLGASGQLPGTVVAVRVDAESAPDPSYAFAPPPPDRKCFRVEIRLDGPPGPAPVAGRRAKVLVAGADAGFFHRALLRLYALGEL